MRFLRRPSHFEDGDAINNLPAEYQVINTIFTNATGQQPPPACAAIVKEK